MQHIRLCKKISAWARIVKSLVFMQKDLEFGPVDVVHKTPDIFLLILEAFSKVLGVVR